MSLERNDIDTASLLLESNFYDHYFFGYFLSDNGDTFKKFARKKRFRISDENLSPRVLNHWIKEGVFHDDRQDNKGWMALSITDAVLITIIKKLRSFGMSLSKIKKMRECLDIYNEMDKESSCLLLDFYLAYGQVSLEPVQLIVLENGKSIIVRQKILNEMLQMGVLTDYIALDLNAILAKGANDRPNMTKYVPNEKEEQIRTELEKEIQNSLQKDGIQNINIKIKDKDYTITSEMLIKDKVSANALMNLCAVAKMEVTKNKTKKFYKVKEIKHLKKNG